MSADRTSAVLAQKSAARLPLSVYGAAWILTAVFLLSNAVTPLYVTWQRNIGFSNGMLTLIFAVYIVGLLIALIFAGQLSDRYGRRLVLLPALAAAIFSCLLFASASSVTTLCAARFLMGTAVGTVVSAGTSAVIDLGGSGGRRATSFIASISIALGGAFGPFFSGGLATILIEPIVPFFMAGLVVLSSALIILLFLPLQRFKPEPNGDARLHLPRVPRLYRKHLACGIAVFASGMAATAFVLALGSSLLSEILRVHSPLVIGALTCMMFLAGTCAQFVLRHLSIRTICLVAASTTMLSTVCLGIAVNASSTSLLIVTALSAGIGQGLGQLGSLTLIIMSVPAPQRAEAIAVLNVGGYVPAGLLPVGAGYLADHVGLAASTTIFAIVLAATIVVTTPLIVSTVRKA